MSENLWIAVVGALAALLTPVSVAFISKWRPGPDGAVQVTTVPSTQTVDSLAKTLAEQGKQITALTQRVGVLEDRERAYIQRIAYLEVWGSQASDPPPRAVPPWVDRPQ